MKKKSWILWVITWLIFIGATIYYHLQFKKLVEKIDSLESDRGVAKVPPKSRKEIINTYIKESQLEKACDEVILWCEETHSHLVDEATLLKGRIARFLANERKGIIPYNDLDINHSQLSNSLLCLVQKIKA